MKIGWGIGQGGGVGMGDWTGKEKNEDSGWEIVRGYDKDDFLA